MYPNKGFTLVEMLIVVIIIGILAVALIPKLIGIQSRARDVARKGDMQQLSVGLASYKLNTNMYPAGSGSVASILSGLVPVYMRSMPRDQLSTAITTNGSQSVVGDYLYISLDADRGYTIISINEGGGRNANRVSNTNSANLTGSNPGLIRSTDQVDVLNSLTCSIVENGILGRIGNTCTANFGAYESKYIIVNN